ncbi:unnamed protein product, partial [Mesorhabditis belari]|uniref:SH3 domain-containing protein n=1 Tax=Mesorhabditis belari TaxID=2138241 RepID=A0AAF3E845_9BILA
MEFLKNKDASFAAAKALFEASKRPEVRSAAVSASQNPVVRNAAKSAAQDPQTRQLVMEALMKQQAQQSGVEAVRTAPSMANERPPPVPRHGSATTSSSTLSKTESKKSEFDNTVTEFALAPPAPTYKQKASSGSFSSAGFVPTQPFVYPSVADELKSLQLSPKKSTPARPPPANRGQISPTNDPYAVVLYPFTGSQFDELSCDAGDKVLLKREVDDQWIYGMNTRTGQHGIMPLSYLDVKVPLVPTQKGANVTTALYDYTTGVDGDLQFRAGDLIDIVEWVDEQWLRGRIGSATGIFPANFVDSQSLTSISKPLRSPMKSSPSKETVTVAYDYNTGMAEDLVCRAGDVVEVVERLDSNWIKGRLRGQTGMIPTTFLQDSSDNRKSMSGFVEREMTVISDYASHEPGHLSVTRGDKVKIVEELDDYWYKGKPLDSVFRFMEPGFIPKHCVQ